MTDQQTDAGTGAAQREPAAGGGRRRGRLLLAVGLATVVVAGAGVAAGLAAVHARGGGPHRPTGIPATISDAQVNLMDLNPVQSSTAPDFTLTDQSGRTLSMASLRGKVVVLQFMDPHCTDICPIVAAEYVNAYHDLGPLAAKVVFAAVNVNEHHAAVSDMLAFSREHQLETIPDWHFFTGAVPALRTVWTDYHVVVEPSKPNADVVHTSVVYFIDPSGRERFIASPQVDHTSSGAAFLPADQVTAWGQGIAQVARTLAG